MTPEFVGLAPSFVGPIAFLLWALLGIVLILLVARIVFGLAWRLVVVGAGVLGVIWLLNAVGSGPPGL